MILLRYLSAQFLGGKKCAPNEKVTRLARGSSGAKSHPLAARSKPEHYSPSKSQLRARCGAHSCGRSMQEFAYLLCEVLSTGSCSQFGLILRPHRVAVSFPPTLASP